MCLFGFLIIRYTYQLTGDVNLKHSILQKTKLCNDYEYLTKANAVLENIVLSARKVTKVLPPICDDAVLQSSKISEKMLEAMTLFAKSGQGLVLRVQFAQRKKNYEGRSDQKLPTGLGEVAEKGFIPELFYRRHDEMQRLSKHVLSRLNVSDDEIKQIVIDGMSQYQELLDRTNKTAMKEIESAISKLIFV